MVTFFFGLIVYQEGLPAYWGIETYFPLLHEENHHNHQEGLPAYWGIETNNNMTYLLKWN